MLNLRYDNILQVCETDAEYVIKTVEIGSSVYAHIILP